MFKRYGKDLLYFLICVLILSTFSFMIWSFLGSNGRSFIYQGDAVPQHYPAAVYWSRYLKECISNIKSGNRIPLWDFCIGFGDDILTTMAYYVGSDVLSFAYLATDTAFDVEEMYGFLVLIRFCAAGLSMFAYLRFKGKSGIAGICGAITYAFSLWSLSASSWHPFFTNALIYLPWLLICIERIFCEKNGILALALVICLQAINSLYFLYINSIAIFIFANLLYFAKYRGKSYLYYFVKATKGYLLGLCCASFVLVPYLYQIFSSRRLVGSVYEHSLYFFDKTYYKDIMASFVNGRTSNYWTVLGFSGITLFSLIYILIAKDKSKTWKYHKVIFWMILAGLCVPVVGMFFNLGSYVSNRWSYLLTALIAVIVAEFVEMLERSGDIDHRAVILSSMIYLIYSTTTLFSDTWRVFVSLLIWLGVLFAIKIRSKRYCSVFMLVLVLFSVYAGNIFSFYKTNIQDFLDKKRTFYLLTWNPFYQQDLNDGISRSSAYTAGSYNKGLMNGAFGTSSYFSFCNGRMGDLFQALNMSTQDTHIQILSLGSQTAISALLNVRYVSVPDGYEHYLPKGYSTTDIKYHGTNIYTNAFFLPFGYTYDKQISRESFDALPSLEKRAVLLKAAIVESGNLTQYEPLTDSYNIPYRVSYRDGIKWEDGYIEVEDKNASLFLAFDKIEDCEYYVSMTGMRCVGEEEDERTMSFSIEGNIKCNVEWRPSDHSYYYGKNDILANIGYSDKGQAYCKITFSDKGRIYYETFEVQALPLSDYEKDIVHLQQDCLENVILGADTIQGEIDLEEEKILCLSIPYTSGWKAYVDGVEENIQCVQIGLSGISLKPGHHEIFLEYCTPGIKIGMTLSLLGVGMYIMIYFCEKRNRYKNVFFDR